MLYFMRGISEISLRLPASVWFDFIVVDKTFFIISKGVSTKAYCCAYGTRSERCIYLISCRLTNNRLLRAAWFT